MCFIDNGHVVCFSNETAPAVNDMDVLSRRDVLPIEGFAFGDGEAAAQRDDFGTAHPKRLQSASPSKTEVAGPVMRIDPPGVQPMSRSPPGRLTVTGPVISLRRMAATRSEEHTSELQSLMRISYAVFCLTKKQKTNSKSHIT